MIMKNENGGSIMAKRDIWTDLHYWVSLLSLISVQMYVCILDDQTQVDSKPAGQPEHASLNQGQLIAVNRPKIGALGTPSWCWR